MAEGTCTVQDCDAPKHGRIYCVKHYRRWKKYGDPLQARPAAEPPLPPATCSIEDCDRPVRIKSRGWCSPHYSRWRDHGDPLGGGPDRPLVPQSERDCSVSDCGSPAKVKGLCGRHYYREWQHGDPLAGRTAVGANIAQFEAGMALVTDECIEWPGPYNRLGYGSIWFDGHHWLTHTLACTRAYGPKPVNKDVAAHGPCHNPRCYNPRHLSWKTHAENMADKTRDGTLLRGEQIAQAKLTEDDVRAIRRRRDAGESLVSIARAFHIHVEHAGLIARRQKIWLHVQ